MRNRKGSTIVMTLIVFTVLMIFGISILNLMVNENKMSLYHQYKTQAYYIARAGAEAVEAAILEMDEEELEKLNEKLEDNNKVDVEEILIGEGKAKEELIKEDNVLTIKSIGEVKGVKNILSKIMKEELRKGKTKIDYAIFSSGDIKLGNGTIEGNIGTNHSVIVANGNPNLNGDIYLTEKGNLSAPDWWEKSWVKTHYIKSGKEIHYESIKFPSFPINNSNIDLIQGGSNQTTISTSKDYNKFEVNANTKIYIDNTKEDIILKIKQFNLNNGHIILLGNNKLTIYVENMVIGSGSTINYEGNQKNTNVFYYGASRLIISGNQKLFANLYINNSELELGGSGSIVGNVYSNGGNIFLSGNSDITKGLIYAPKTDINFTGSGKAYGAVIGKTVNISGGGKVVYDPNYVDNSIIGGESTEKILFKPSHYK
ncbi:PilX N-terminal domain-containing pilus assembly protein [Tissierella pigra]|uniref:DUF7305 domain-containing protein n=1 Tax=Tissierella pigra TaxID=2607614 RepID=A0A6N7XR51_9FIRM|nr:PilX N-terminal domain-containing pilus assembly protein [Tissierella pigra]MST99872.1 hypothetical protein [Tissierella pigra]